MKDIFIITSLNAVRNRKQDMGQNGMKCRLIYHGKHRVNLFMIPAKML